MVGLDLGAFPSEVAKLLLLRGATLPPVLWTGEQLRLAKKTLDGLDDAGLLAASVADEQAAAASRALLYLWGGFFGECSMFSQAAAEPERLYIISLCDRHQGRFTEAKAHLKQMATHPIYEELATSTLRAAAAVADPSVKRLREMLELDSRWEPYLFCDAIAQASAGKVKPSGENIIRQIECREFELLLTYCFEKAIGTKLTQRACIEPSDAERKAAERERRMREERRRKDEKRKREEFARASAAPAPHKPADPAPVSSKTDAPKSVEQKVGVLCPKCGHTQQVSGAMRGKVTQCPKCSTSFVIPKPGSGSGDRASASGAVGVLCPKCGKKLVLPASARGKKTTCTGCGASFLVPQLQPATTH